MRPWKRRMAVVAIMAVILGTAGFVLLRSRGLSPGYVGLRTFTDDASGLMDGIQVRLNGIQIGYLEGQKLTNSRDPAHKVELHFKVRVSYLDKIPEDSVAGLASDNLLGDEYIAIHRGQSVRHIASGGELRSMQAQDFGKMMARMGQEMDRLQGIAVRADKLLAGTTAGRGSVGKIVTDPNLKKAGGMSEQVDALTAEMQHGRGTIAKLFYEDPLSVQMQSPQKRLDDILATAGHRTDEIKELSAGLDRSSRDLKALQAELTAGKGSLGKLNELQQRFDGLTAKWNAMVDRVNSGQGTMGQLTVNPQLNQALDNTTREYQELLKGLKTNPWKFVAIRLF